LAWVSIVKKWAPDSVAMAIMASVATVRASGFNPSWLKRDQNLGFLYNVLMAAGVTAVLAAVGSSMSASLAFP
jgi:hypothetical protein